MNNKNICPVCEKTAIVWCKCASFIKHTIDDLNNGHGYKCENNHSWTYNTKNGEVMIINQDIKEDMKPSTNPTKMGNKVSDGFKKQNIKGLKITENNMENTTFNIGDIVTWNGTKGSLSSKQLYMIQAKPINKIIDINGDNVIFENGYAFPLISIRPAEEQEILKYEYDEQLKRNVNPAKYDLNETSSSSSSGQYSSKFFVDPNNLKGRKPLYKGGVIIEPNPNTHDAGVNSFKVIKGKLNESEMKTLDELLVKNLDKIGEEGKKFKIKTKDGRVVVVKYLGKSEKSYNNIKPKHAFRSLTTDDEGYNDVVQLTDDEVRNKVHLYTTANDKVTEEDTMEEAFGRDIKQYLDDKGELTSIKTNEKLNNAIDEYISQLQQTSDNKFQTEYPNSWEKGLAPKFEKSVGEKYIKILMIAPGQKSPFCFIDINGNIYKPATFATPAKGVRGNVYNEKKPLSGRELYIREEENIGEAKEFKVDPKYTHFAVRKDNNLIVNGWDYKGVDKNDIIYYVKMDLNDLFPNNRASDFKVLTIKGLEKQGINPFDWNSWEKTNDSEIDETTGASSSGAYTGKLMARIGKPKPTYTGGKLVSLMEFNTEDSIVGKYVFYNTEKNKEIKRAKIDKIGKSLLNRDRQYLNLDNGDKLIISSEDVNDLENNGKVISQYLSAINPLRIKIMNDLKVSNQLKETIEKIAKEFNTNTDKVGNFVMESIDFNNISFEEDSFFNELPMVKEEVKVTEPTKEDLEFKSYINETIEKIKGFMIKNEIPENVINDRITESYINSEDEIGNILKESFTKKIKTTYLAKKIYNEYVII